MSRDYTGSGSSTVTVMYSPPTWGIPYKYSKHRMQSTKSKKQASAKPSNSRRRGQRQGNSVPKQVSNPRAPVAIGSVTRTNKPKISASSSREGGIVIRHREYLDEAIGSDAFNASTLSLNPGLPVTFPWLSTIANSFETYRFKRLWFIYKPSCPTTVGGKVILSVDYDANDPTPLSKVQQLQNKTMVDGPPWTEFRVELDPRDMDSLGPRHFTRVNFAGVTGQDVKTYDVGRLVMSTSGFTAPFSVCGELWTEYEIELFTPQPNSPSQYSEKFVPATFSAAAPFGTAVGTISGSALFTHVDGTHLNCFCPGEYLMVVNAVGTGLVNPTFTVGTNFVVVDLLTTNGSATNASYIYRIRGLDFGDKIEIAWAATTLTTVAYRFAPYLYSNN